MPAWKISHPRLLLHLSGVLLGAAGCSSPVPSCSSSVQASDIQFGLVAASTTAVGEIRLSNVGQTRAIVEALAVGGIDSAAFAPSPPRTFPILLVVEPARTTSLPVSFRPIHPGPHIANLILSLGVACPNSVVRLTGEGGPSSIDIDSTLDFGSVALFRHRSSRLVIENRGYLPIHATEASEIAPADVGFFVRSLSGTEAAPGNSLEVEVAFQPHDAGFFAANLTLHLQEGFPVGPRFAKTVSLTGSGGAPQVEVEPGDELSFGLVPFLFATTPPFSVFRRVFVTNRGQYPLLFEANDAGAPFAVSALSSGTTPSEIAFELDSATLDAGILPGGRAYVTVTLSPASFGPKSGDLVIHTNSFDNPDRRLRFSGSTVQTAPCTLTAPSVLDLGEWDGGQWQADLSIANPIPFSTCFLTNLEIDAGTLNAFALASAPVDYADLSREVDGGVLSVRIRIDPNQIPLSFHGPLTGSVSWSQPFPNARRRTAVLRATVP